MKLIALLLAISLGLVPLLADQTKLDNVFKKACQDNQGMEMAYITSTQGVFICKDTTVARIKLKDFRSTH